MVHCRFPSNVPVRIFLTGATGVMGLASMKEIVARADEQNYILTVLARPSGKNKRLLARFTPKGVKVIWGDLLDPDKVRQGVADADIILHLGGLVSPMADMYPEKTLKVNIGSMQTVCDAVLQEQRRGHCPKVVYIGSVSQYGYRGVPHHWGKIGDPLKVVKLDAYAFSKVCAERLLVESGVIHWVSLRQSGILHPGLLGKTDDPIMFHVPLRGVLEWVTDEQSGRLMERVCRRDVPDSFWNNFYNIGGGEKYRLTNYEFEKLILSCLGCPPVEKIFDARWFAVSNFHGMWYLDSDILENLFHFRGDESPEEYFLRKKRNLPWYIKLAPLAPAFIMKQWMRHVANKAPLGTLSWLKNGDDARINAFFGGRKAWNSLPGWKSLDLSRPSGPPEEQIISKNDSKMIPEQLTSRQLEEVAVARGGRYLGNNQWQCTEGHSFSASPRLIILGGHWCPQCLKNTSSKSLRLHDSAALV